MYIVDSGVTAAKAIAYCKSQLGKPYVWGATGPNSFDCSGLMYTAYREAGLKEITRTTYTQIRQGDAVADDAAGDLWFPDFGHVGISLGDGSVIHAPQSGDVVKVQKKWKKPVAIRRLVAPASASSMEPGNGISGVVNPFNPLDGLLGGLSEATSWIVNPQSWIRIAMMALGVLSLGIALWMVIT